MLTAGSQEMGRSDGFVAFYGFALYLASFSFLGKLPGRFVGDQDGLVLYVGWAVVPQQYLNMIGLEYLPDKWAPGLCHF